MTDSTTPRQLQETLLQALSKCDTDAVSRCIAQDPSCIARFGEDLYWVAAQEFIAAAESDEACLRQMDSNLVDLFNLINPHTTDTQDSKLQVAAQWAGTRRWTQTTVWLLDHGAKMTAQIASDLLGMLWLDPEKANTMNVLSWHRSSKIKIEQWRHDVLAVLAFAGATPETIEATQERMKCNFTVKRLARAVVRGAGMELIDRAMGRGSHVKATPESLGWLDDKLKGRLRTQIEKLSVEFECAKPVYLSILDTRSLDQATVHTFSSVRRARI